MGVNYVDQWSRVTVPHAVLTEGSLQEQLCLVWEVEDPITIMVWILGHLMRLDGNL